MEDYVRGYKYRIYPTQEQEAKFNQMFGNSFLGVRQTCCRGSFLCVMWLFPCLLLAKKRDSKRSLLGGRFNKPSRMYEFSKENQCI